MPKWKPGPGYKGADLPAVQKGKRRTAPAGVDVRELKKLSDAEFRKLVRSSCVPYGTLIAFEQGRGNLSQAQHDAVRAALQGATA